MASTSVLRLFFLCATIVATLGKKLGPCLGINAQLNAFFKDQDTNSLRDVASPDGTNLFAIGRFHRFDRKTMEVDFWGSQLWSIRMKYDPMSAVQKSLVLDDQTIKALNSSNHDIFLYSMSDSCYGRTIQRNDAVQVVALTVRSFVNVSRLRDVVHFFQFRASERGFTLQPETKESKEVFPYEYPFETPQPVFDSMGNIVGVEDVHSVDSVSVLSTEDFPRQIRLACLRCGIQRNLVQFVSMIYTQRSLKLVRYSWDVTPSSSFGPVVEDALMIVPRIRSFDSDSSFAAYLTLSNDRTLAYITLAMHVAQIAAFETLHPNTSLSFEAFVQSDIVPVLIVVDVSARSKMSVLSAASLMPLDIEKFPLAGAWPSDLDVRGNKVLVSGNTYRGSGITAVGLDLRPWSSIVTVSSSGRHLAVNTSFSIASLKQFGKKLEELKGDVVFNAAAIAWPIDNRTERFLVGGSLFSFPQGWNRKGRAFLIDVDSRRVLHYTQMGLSDGLSNMLQDIYRIARIADSDSENTETMFLNLYEGGPKVPPPTPLSRDTHRAFDADLWQVDCSLPNYELERTARVIFFVFVGVSALLFGVSVVVFVGKAICDCNRRRVSRRTPLSLLENT